MDQVAKRETSALAFPGETRLNAIPEQDIKGFLAKEIYKLYGLAGNSKFDPKDVALTANEIYITLSETWPGVKIVWIQSAFKKGILGEYGEYYGINYVTLMKFIKTFRSYMKREDFTNTPEPKPISEKVKDLATLTRQNPDKLPYTNELLNRYKSKRKSCK